MTSNKLSRELEILLAHPTSYFKDKLVKANKTFDFHKPVILFGAAKMGKILSNLLSENNIEILAYCDNDNQKWGRRINNIQIINSKKLLDNYSKSTQIIVSSLYDGEIKTQLDKLGFKNVWSHTYFFTMFTNKFSSLAWTNDINAINSQKQIIMKAFKLLNDDESKITFLNVLKYRLTLNREYIHNIVVNNSEIYFDTKLVNLTDNEVFVDGGAYDGDTLIPFITATNNKFNTIYCFEPDQKSFAKLKKLVNFKLKDTRIRCIPSGLGKNKQTVYFNDGGGLGSNISNSGGSKVDLVTIDSYLDQEPTMIKLDIEGYEKEALLGAKETIKNNKPKLAICSYHYQSDLWEIPLLMNKLNNKYKIFLRHYGQYVFDTICYGI